MASRNATKTSSTLTRKTQSFTGNVWPPNNCTPLCPGSAGCSYSGKHHELILSLFKCSDQGNGIEKSDFKNVLDKFIKTRWIRDDCIPDKSEELHFPLVHWACIFGRYKLLEYLIREKGFKLTVTVGRNKEGPLFSMVRHLSNGMPPKSSKEKLGNMFGSVIDIFMKYSPEGLFERESSNDNTILHFCAERCCEDPSSRKYLEVLLVKIKESDKFPPEKEEELLSAVNKKGDTFLHLMVSDEMSTDILTNFFANFSKVSEKISIARNSLGKCPRQIAVEKRSVKVLKTLGAPDVVMNSLKKALIVPSKPKNSLAVAEETPKTVAKPSSSSNGTSSDRENRNSKSALNHLGSAVKGATGVSFAEQPEVPIITDAQLQVADFKMCSCEPVPSSVENDCSTPTRRPLKPFPQRYPVPNGKSTTPQKPFDVPKNIVLPSTESIDMVDAVTVVDLSCVSDVQEADPTRDEYSVFVSLSNSIRNCAQKRTAPGSSRAKGPKRKKVRTDLSSDSNSDDEEGAGWVALDDDSDDDVESAGEEDDEDEDEEDMEVKIIEGDDVKRGEKEGKSPVETDLDLEDAVLKHTPFCGKNCDVQHDRLLLALLKSSNHRPVDSFITQVKEYVNQLGKFSDVWANADLPDPVNSFKYPLVHWVCVLGKFKVLEKLAAMKEFDLGVQSTRTGETGLHRMLLSLHQAIVRRKSPTKAVLEVFSKTLRVLTDNLPGIITVCNKEGDSPFHCLAKVILDSVGELERMNTFEGYFEHLVKELNRLRRSEKLASEDVRELLLKTNNSRENFLHILACRHGVGHRVIKSVLRNIEPDIMAALQAAVNADGKTPSDLAEDLCSYEMAEILRPLVQETSTKEAHPVQELPPTPERNALPELSAMNSPPAALFHSTENSLSISVQVPVKEELIEDGFLVEPSEKSSNNVNDSSGPSEVQADVPSLTAVKCLPGTVKSTIPSFYSPAKQDVDTRASSSVNGRTENIVTVASDSDANSQPKNNNMDSSILSVIMRMPGVVKSLRDSVQTKLTQSQRELADKEYSLAQVHQRKSDLEKRKQKLLKELEETWKEVNAAAQEEGVLQAEIAARKKDIEAFKVELTKYESKRQ